LNYGKNLNELRDHCHRIAKEHGWYDEDREVGTILTLMHCELSEAFEEYREKGITYEFWEELGDVIIRILDYCGSKDIDIDAIVRAKMRENEGRPYRHGGKKA